MPESAADYRAGLARKLFPRGIPKLWSPPLCHYTDDGKIDRKHIRAHLAHMAPHVKTHLIPGSTGDGWELSEKEIDELLEFIIKETGDLGVRLLIGVLRPDGDDARRDIVKTVEWLKALTGVADPEKALSAAGVCGFTVCAPKGRAVSQEFMGAKLAAILELGYPTALYQLPQITENEIAPKTLEALAGRYGNFYLWKDTSGRDAVSLSGADLGGVFTVRGGEGAYARWYRGTPGGLYYGFLLGSANCFARQYDEVIRLADAGKHEEASALSDRLSRAVTAALEWAGKIPFGNAFANSNKAFDHFFAHGPGAMKIPAPMTHSGNRLPDEYVKFAGDLLEDEGFMPERGYME
jgi:dihydrodipicolinate synthase/N-acetylneuraminate lyase